MAPDRSSTLQMPSFLHGTFMSVARETRKEGHRCGEQYRKDGTTLDPASFERMSAACTSDLLGHLYAWDRQLGMQ